MTIQQMQQQLISQIGNIQDEDILRMLEEELSYSLESKKDLANLLSKEDFEELKSLAAEPIDKNTMSFKDFNSKIDQWRTKS